jgi:quercetin dioxygenase-like cupin family protein
MSLVTFEDNLDNKVTEKYSSATGPVLRGVDVELAKLHFKKGGGAREHSHPEEQIVYVLSGLARATVGGESYEVHPGQASYHPPNVPHSFEILEDFEGLSFKHLVAPIYEATGQL